MGRAIKLGTQRGAAGLSLLFINFEGSDVHHGRWVEFFLHIIVLGPTGVLNVRVLMQMPPLILLLKFCIHSSLNKWILLVPFQVVKLKKKITKIFLFIILSNFLPYYSVWYLKIKSEVWTVLVVNDSFTKVKIKTNSIICQVMNIWTWSIT